MAVRVEVLQRVPRLSGQHHEELAALAGRVRERTAHLVTPSPGRAARRSRPSLPLLVAAHANTYAAKRPPIT